MMDDMDMMMMDGGKDMMMMDGDMDMKMDKMWEHKDNKTRH